MISSAFASVWASQFCVKDWYVWDNGRNGLRRDLFVICAHPALFWALLGQVWCQQKKTEMLSYDFAWARWWEGGVAPAAAVRHLYWWGGTAREEPCRDWRMGHSFTRGSVQTLPHSMELGLLGYQWVSLQGDVCGVFNSCPSEITFI